MKVLLFTLGILVTTAAIGMRAEAVEYPWCAQYSGGDNGGTNCGFVSRQQCQVTVSGVGGTCVQNTQYQASGGAYPAQRSHAAGKHS